VATRYAERADVLAGGLPEATLDGFDDPTVEAILDARSAHADGFFAQRYTLPLTAWDAAVRMHVVNLASWDLIVKRGYVPNDPWDEGIRARAEAAETWLLNVSRGHVKPAVTDSAPAVAKTYGVVVVSQPRRGW
jgi:phage gp36-like protein